MPTNRQMISDIVGPLKLLNRDDRISNRMVLSMLKDKTQNFIKQDMDNRRLFKVTSLWRRIKCFELCEANLVECDCAPACKQVMVSRKKLPDLFTSNYGNLVKVLTLNGEKEFFETTIAKYKEIVRREYNDSNAAYFWIDNGYLYIPDSFVGEVLVLGFFKNPHDVDVLNGEDKQKETCLSPLDDEFPCPDYLIDIVKSAVKSELLTESQRVEDNRGDLNKQTKV